MTETSQPNKAAAAKAAPANTNPNPPIVFADITVEDEAMYCATAVGWEPQPGDELYGTVLRVQVTTSEVEDANSPTGKRRVSYPLMTMIRDGQHADEFAVNVHAFHTVLASTLAAQRPVRGDVVYIRRLKDQPGKSNREATKMYAATVTKPGGKAHDPWDQWAATGKG